MFFNRFVAFPSHCSSLDQSFWENQQQAADSCHIL